MAQPKELFFVVSDIFRINDRPNLSKEDAPVDIHEESLDVELEDVRRARIILAHTPHECIDPLDTEQCPLSFSATVGIMDKYLLKKRIETTDDIMVHDPITEVPGENLAFDGMIHDEGDRLAHRIRFVTDFFVESNNIRLIIELESERVDRFSFVTTALVIGFEEVGEVHGILFDL